jgi:hypothetical protein
MGAWVSRWAGPDILDKRQLLCPAGIWVFTADYFVRSHISLNLSLLRTEHKGYVAYHWDQESRCITPLACCIRYAVKKQSPANIS